MPTITTTSNCETTGGNSPYLNALASTRRSKHKKQDEKTDKKDNFIQQESPSNNSVNNNLSLSRDTAISALTTKVESLTLLLTSAQKEIEESK